MDHSLIHKSHEICYIIDKSFISISYLPRDSHGYG